jgi:hypothetical protein
VPALVDGDGKDWQSDFSFCRNDDKYYQGERGKGYMGQKVVPKRLIALACSGLGKEKKHG